MESVAYQSYDLLKAMKNEGINAKIIKVDGGMAKNNWLLQFLADVNKIKVYRPQIEETTALGAAFLAGLKIGIFKSLNDISKKWKLNKKFIPKMKNSERLNLLKGWSQTMRKTLMY